MGSWVSREQWMERITILEDIIGYYKQQTITPSRTQAQLNILNIEAAYPNFTQLSVEKWSTEDLKDNSQKIEFTVGQRIEAKDGGWFDAIIKQVGVTDYGERCVRVGW
eukprot:163384_1